MVVLQSVLVDTDVLIKAYRGDKMKQSNLKLLKDKYCISIITACELLFGAKSINQREEFNKLLSFYRIVNLDEKPSEEAFSLYKKYSFKNEMKISDTFIAAIAIRHDLLVYTDNKRDFDFIKEVKFFTEKI